MRLIDEQEGVSLGDTSTNKWTINTVNYQSAHQYIYTQTNILHHLSNQLLRLLHLLRGAVTGVMPLGGLELLPLLFD